MLHFSGYSGSAATYINNLYLLYRRFSSYINNLYIVIVYTKLNCLLDLLCVLVCDCRYTWVDLEKNFWGGGNPNIVGIKVAKLNVFLDLPLRTSLNTNEVS